MFFELNSEKARARTAAFLFFFFFSLIIVYITEEGGNIEIILRIEVRTDIIL
jgi:hypothetical protein